MKKKIKFENFYSMKFVLEKTKTVLISLFYHIFAVKSAKTERADAAKA